MKLPNPKYFTIEELAVRWETDSKRVEHYLIEGMLRASIKLKPTFLVRYSLGEDGKEQLGGSANEKGYFQIQNYDEIVWSYDKDFGKLLGLSCDFFEKKIRLIRDGIVYGFGFNFDSFTAMVIIKPSDILIMTEEVNRFELEHGMSATCCADNKAQAVPTQDKQVQEPKSSVKYRPKDKAPITQVIDAFFEAPYKPHSKANFYVFVKEQLANKLAEINGVLFSELIECAVTAERGKGVYMVKPKEGAKSQTNEDYRYSDKAIGERLATARKKRNIEK